MMTDEMQFFLFLIERYANHKNRPTGDVMREWDQKGVTQEWPCRAATVCQIRAMTKPLRQMTNSEARKGDL